MAGVPFKSLNIVENCISDMEWVEKGDAQL